MNFKRWRSYLLEPIASVRYATISTTSVTVSECYSCVTFRKSIMHAIFIKQPKLKVSVNLSISDLVHCQCYAYIIDPLHVVYYPEPILTLIWLLR